MADYVPTTGPWQTDAELQRLTQAMVAAQATNQGRQQSAAFQAASLAFRRYVEANRQRLGIPNNYWPDPRTQGRTLYDPNQNQLRDAGIVAASGVGAGFGASALAGAAGGGAPAGGASGAASAGGSGGVGSVVAPGVVNLATPASDVAASAIAPVGSLATAAPPAAAAAQGARSFGDTLKAGLTNPNNLASLAGLVTSLAGGSGGGGNGQTNADLARAQAITEARMRRVDPLHQAITNLAMSRLPTNMQRPVPDVPLPGVK